MSLALLVWFSSFLLDLSAEQWRERIISIGEFSARYAESILCLPLFLPYVLFNVQNSIEDGEFSFDANFVSREFLGKIAEEMDSLDKTFLFAHLWWKNIYLEINLSNIFLETRK